MTDKAKLMLDAVPTFFVDQPAAIRFGAHVCKVTFGEADPGEGKFPRPTVSVVIPTLSLLRFVNDLKEKFEDPAFKKLVTERYERDAERIKAGDVRSGSKKLLPATKGRQSQAAKRSPD